MILVSPEGSGSPMVRGRASNCRQGSSGSRAGWLPVETELIDQVPLQAPGRAGMDVTCCTLHVAHGALRAARCACSVVHAACGTVSRLTAIKSPCASRCSERSSESRAAGRGRSNEYSGVLSSRQSRHRGCSRSEWYWTTQGCAGGRVGFGQLRARGPRHRSER
jgi:hypothetical protein